MDDQSVGESRAKVAADIDPISLTVEPYLCPRVWGGQRFARLAPASVPSGAGPIGESWILSGYPERASRIVGGPWDGRSLNEVWQARRSGWTSFVETGDPSRFPLLVKFLDCWQSLSVQVHPNNEQAEHWNSGLVGKSEAWLVLQSAPGSRLYAGLKAGVTASDVERGVRAGTMTELLHSIEPQPGDSFEIPPGTVHAIGAGLLLLEVQQSSDATFRLYDWNRTNSGGTPRPLHIEQALSCIDWNRGPIGLQMPETLQGLPPGVTGERLVANSHFIMDRLASTAREWEMPAANELAVWVQMTGSSELVHPSGDRRIVRPGTMVMTLPNALPWVRHRLSGIPESCLRVTLPNSP